MAAKRVPAALLALLVGLAVAACGGSGTHARNAAATVTAKDSRTPAAKAAARAAASAAATAANLRTRPKGELILDGFSEGSLSQLAYRAYQNQGGTEVVSIENNSVPTAFDNLCDGSVDVVDSATPISGATLKRCHRDGITPVQIQVGSDAVVLATENETDVGSDCLTMAQVRTIFKAGSPVENWDQLGFDDVALATAGPNPANENFAFFGPALVGENTPTLQDFRFDYRAYTDEDSIRRFVVGSEQSGEFASAQLPAALGEVQNLEALIAGWKATLRGADAYVTSATQQDNVTEIALATAKRARAIASLDTLEHELAADHRLIAHYRTVERNAEGVLGRLGVFQYGYYTLFEEQLRPLEITARTSPENCVFPSQDTITSGDYPLSRQLLLTVSLQELRSSSALRGFLLSYLKNADTLTTDQVLVPLPASILTQEEDVLTGVKPPTTVTTSGATAAENSMTGSGQSITSASGTSPATGSAGTSGSTGSEGSLVPQGVH